MKQLYSRRKILLLHALLCVLSSARPASNSLFHAAKRPGIARGNLALRGGSKDETLKRSMHELDVLHETQNETVKRRRGREDSERGFKEWELAVPLANSSMNENCSEPMIDSQATVPTDLVDEIYSFMEENSISSSDLESSGKILKKLDERSIKVDEEFRLKNQFNSSFQFPQPQDSEGMWTNVALLYNNSHKVASDDESADDAGQNGIQQFDFELFDPVKADRDSISSLLQGYMGPLHFDSWLLACDIVRQADHVGSVLKVGGGEPMGFISMLQLEDFKEREWCKKFLAFVRSQCPRPLRPQVYDLIGDVGDPSAKKRIGLILCERVLNVPVSLSLPMYKTLFEEIKDAQKNQTQEEGQEEGVRNETDAEESDEEFNGSNIVTKDWNVDYYMILVRKLLWEPTTRQRRMQKRKMEGFSGHDSLLSVSAENIKSLAGSADLSVDGSSLLGVRIRNLTVNGNNAGEEYLLEDSKLFRDLAEVSFSVSFRRVGQVMEGVSRRNEICFIRAGMEDALVARLRQEVGEEAFNSSGGYQVREEE
uniref:Uncharacterized protein n=1 Tax=Guillardia theta TaxID=55529 RepID=A0A7S4UPZ0_GUITH|mmetsp:Transcript_42392/g.133546  ORF Transcript_42392/g.133546 Transcript_42392/m.133546 type:complete len:539 (+) Transcript_42392:136-1752(+)